MEREVNLALGDRVRFSRPWVMDFKVRQVLPNGARLVVPWLMEPKGPWDLVNGG